MARTSSSRRRRRRVVVGIVVVAVVALAGAGLLLRPAPSSASSALTVVVHRADVASTVSASGSVVDRYTYSVAAGGTPALTELAGVATGATASSASASASGSGQGAGTAGSSASGASTGYTTRSIAVAAGDAVAKNAKIAVARGSDGKDRTVTSPVAGRVRSLTTAVGASASTVATIGSGGELVSIAVDENRIAAVRADQAVALTLGSGGAAFTGRVRSIAQLPDGSSGVQQYQVLVAPDRLPTGARIGMTVTASIRIDARQHVLTVPAGAVTTSHGEAAVRVVSAAGATRVVRVETGLIGDSAVEVVRGLKAGQRVVTGGAGAVPAASTVQRPASN